MTRRPIRIPALVALAATGLGGCVRDVALPDPGECAVVPSAGTYSWGQIDIGTCLAGPSDLQVWPDPDDPDRYWIAVVNSNFEASFSSGSLLLIPSDGLDLSAPTHYLHEVSASAVPLPTFPARVGLDPERRTAFVSVRSAAGIDGQMTDRLFAVDVTDPREPAFAAAAPEHDDAGAYIHVPADPFSVVFQASTGHVYVLDLTTHDVAVIDALADPYVLVDVRGEATVSTAAFDDADGSGSVADFELGLFQPEIASDDTWTITYSEGTYRLYYAARDGAGDAVYHADSGDGARFVVGQGGPDLPFADDESWYGAGWGAASAVLEIDSDEGVAELTLFVEAFDGIDGTPSLARVSTTETATTWSDPARVLLPGNPGDFDEAGVGDPSALLPAGGDYEVFYTGYAADGATAIGRATSTDGSTYGRTLWGDERDPGFVLGAGGEGAWDASGVSSPTVAWVGEKERYQLYYDSPDSAAGGIGLAIGADAGSLQRVEIEAGAPGRVLAAGEEGTWDAEWIGSPSVFRDLGRFHMYYAGTDGFAWGIGHATSLDGLSWVKDSRNPVLTEPDGGLRKLEPGGYKAAAGGTWRVEGELAGLLPEAAVSNLGYEFAASPVLFVLVDGFVLGLGAEGEIDEGGAASPAVRLGDDGSADVLYEARGDAGHRLARARSEEGMALDRLGEVGLDPASLTGELAQVDGFAAPAWADTIGPDSIVFTGIAGDRERVYLASPAADGAWAAEADPLLQEGAEGSWDTFAVGSAHVVEGDGEVLLYYEGHDGDRFRIGLATSPDSADFTREAGAEAGTAGLVLDRGEPGDWDDAEVRGPCVLWDPAAYDGAGGYRMWYSGSDGQTWRIGTAESPDGRAWERHLDGDGRPASVLGPESNVPAADEEGAFDPAVAWDADRGVYRLWYQAVREGAARLAYAESEDGVHWLKLAPMPTSGDSFSLATTRGDDTDTSTIYLGDERTGIVVDGEIVRGSGVSDMVLSPDGRFLLVANKKFDNVYVLDVHDDSTPEQADANYLGVEAVIRTRLDDPVVGTRGMAFSADGTRLYALLSPLVVPEDTSSSGRRSGPEAVLVLDATLLVESPEPYILDDAVIGWLPAERGIEEDQGATSGVSVGLANLELTADGRYAYVAHFNQNSVEVYDLDKGWAGMPVDRVLGLGEAPYDLALSPDGKLLFVANYVGELSGLGANETHSTISVIDVDPESPTWHTVLTTLRNRDAT